MRASASERHSTGTVRSFPSPATAKLLAASSIAGLRSRGESQGERQPQNLQRPTRSRRGDEWRQVVAQRVRVWASSIPARKVAVGPRVASCMSVISERLTWRCLVAGSGIASSSATCP
jgi:hypothetical protein